MDRSCIFSTADRTKSVRGIVPESVQTAVMRVLPQINRWNTGYYYWLYVPIYGLHLSWLKGKKHQLALSLGGLILPLLLVFDWEYTQTGSMPGATLASGC